MYRDSRSDPHWDNSLILTEDKIPVKTIYVSGLHERCMGDDVSKYFSSFGKIENIKIIRKRTFAFALITFETTAQAANAIRIRKHFFHSKRLKVSAADSWHQSSSKNERIENDVVASNSDYDESMPTAILKLNDDCLLHLSKYLDLIDLVHLSLTCAAMQSFVRENFYRKYKTLNLDYICNFQYNLSLHNLRNLFMETRDFVEKIQTSFLNLNTRHIRIIDMIGKHMHNLQELHLKNAHTKTIRFPKTRYKSPYTFGNLKVLTLDRCCNICDNIISAAPNLVELNLSYSSGIYNNCFRNLASLKKLTIKYCEIKPTIVLQCLEFNRQITHLTLKGILRLNRTNKFNLVISGLTSLQYLSTDCLDKWPLESLDSLKSLSLLSSYSSVNSMAKIPPLKSLAEKDKLEELDISRCVGYDDAPGVFQKNLLTFTKIQVLNVSYTTFISEEFLLQLATHLDLTSLSCDAIELSDDTTVKIVEVSKHLKQFSYFNASILALKRIIEIVKNDMERPKLVIVAAIDDSQKNVLNELYERVEITNSLYEEDDIIDFTTDGDEFSDNEFMELNLFDLDYGDLFSLDSDDVYYSDDLSDGDFSDDNFLF